MVRKDPGHAISGFLRPDTHNKNVLGLPLPYLSNKTSLETNCFLKSKYGGEDIRHAFSCVLGPETHKNALLRSSPTTF